MFKNKRFWAVLKLILLLVVLILFIQSLNHHLVLQTVKNIGIGYLLSAFGLQLTMRLMSAWQLQRLLKTETVKTSILELFGINLTTAFYGVVIPGEVASAGVGWYKLRVAGNEGKRALTALMMTGAVNVAILMVFGGIFWIAQAGLSTLNTFIALCGVTALIAVGYGLRWIGSQAIRRMAKTISLVGRCVSALKDTIPTFGLGETARVIAISALIHVCGILSHLVFAHAVQLSLTIWTIGWIRSACLLAGFLPLSVAGFGIREASLIYLLNMYGATPEQAVVYSMLTIVVVFGAAIMGAGVEMVSVMRRMAKG